MPVLLSAIAAVAVSALQAIAAQHSCHEVAGAVIESAGLYRASELAYGNDDRVKLVVRLAGGEHIVAVFHTHPSCERRGSPSLFSAADVAMARSLGVPSFLGVLGKAQVRLFMPRDPVNMDGTAGGRFESRIME
jgi:hypothetical protein